jgi:murein DD-endopeptidase MepM/ murein hydrolase activator NlpD
LLDGSNAANLLSSIGVASKFSQQANDVYTQAIQDKNSAQSLTDTANVAKGILQGLKDKAQAAFDIAQNASNAAQAAYAESAKHRAELEAQLAAFRANAKAIEAKYLKGVQAAYGAGSGLGAGEISPSGWARPVAGWITSGFGWRIHPVSGVWRFHSGTDIAGPGCGAPIYAAHAGRVIYAGWYGSYGNFILIQNSDTISTGYAHIVTGGTLVRAGQEVGVGQNIAREGTTGDSTGCHLHFEVRINGVAVNAVPFMRSQGIIIG